MTFKPEEWALIERGANGETGLTGLVPLLRRAQYSQETILRVGVRSLCQSLLELREFLDATDHHG